MRSNIRRRLAHSVAITLLFSLPTETSAAVENCLLRDQNIQLTPEVLTEVGWQGMTFGKTEFIPKTLAVRFPSFCFEGNLSKDSGTCVGLLPVNEDGDLRPALLQAVHIEVFGNFEVNRRELLEEFYLDTIKRTPFQAGRDRYSVGGGFLRLRDNNTIFFPVTSHFEDYSGGDIKLKKGDAYVGANLNAALSYSSDRRDVGIKMAAEVTYVRVTSPWDDFINFLTAPSAFVLPFGGKMLGDMIVDPKIEDAKQELPKEGSTTEVELTEYDLKSVNAFVESTILNFSNIYVEVLKFDENSGFTGENPTDRPPFIYVPRDADVGIVLSKSSDPADANTFTSRATACLFSEALALGLVQQTGSQSVKVQVGDTLADIATRTYGSERLVAEIAQRNNLADPDRINPGSTLFLPTFDDYADEGVHVVQQGESLWSIAESLGEPSVVLKSIIQLNPTIGDPSRIDPMMTIRLPPSTISD